MLPQGLLWCSAADSSRTDAAPGDPGVGAVKGHGGVCSGSEKGCCRLQGAGQKEKLHRRVLDLRHITRHCGVQLCSSCTCSLPWGAVRGNHWSQPFQVLYSVHLGFFPFGVTLMAQLCEAEG